MRCGRRYREASAAAVTGGEGRDSGLTPAALRGCASEEAAAAEEFVRANGPNGRLGEMYNGPCTGGLDVTRSLAYPLKKKNLGEKLDP